MICKLCGKPMDYRGIDDGGCNYADGLAELWYCENCDFDDCTDVPNFEDESDDDETDE